MPKKYCVARLKEDETADAFRESVESQLPDIDDTNWDSLKKALLNSAETILGLIKHHHKDWFDDNDAEIRELLDQRANRHIDKRRNINREIKNELRQMVTTTSCRNTTARRQWQHERTFPVTKVHLWTKDKCNCSRVLA